MENEIITVENKENKGNPNHKPAGSPEGGQFTSAPGTNLKSSLLDFIKTKKGEGLVVDDNIVDNIVNKYVSYNYPLDGKNLKMCLKAGTPEAQKTVNDFFTATGVKMRRCEKGKVAHWSTFWHSINLQPSDLKIVGKHSGNYELGETLFHETFHGIDQMYGDITSSYKLSNGKTLKDVYHGEISEKKYAWNMNLFNSIKKEYEMAVEEEMSKMFSPEQAKEYNEKIDYYRKAMQNLNNEFGKKNSIKFYSSIQEYNEAFDNYKNEWKKLKKELTTLNDIALPAQQKAIHKYSCLSDMCSFIYKTGIGNNSICGGHPKKYWSMDNGNKASKEIWAELGSMWARGKKDDINRIRKYFPNTVSAFEELLGKLEDIRKGKYGK